jgi:hypothetical protein
MIDLPVDFVSDITANASAFMADLSPYATLIIGVILATLVLTILIGAIKK